jgi:peptidoglycan-N-acetylglucosamine deacetylase
MFRRAVLRFLPSPLLQASALLHASALAAMLLRPRVWPYSLGAILADQLLLTGVGLVPRSTLLGPNWVRLPAAAAARGAVALTIDDGPDPAVTPRVLDLLAARGARATFFCIGERVRRHADLAREIVRRGHCIENHSYHHLRRFSVLGPGAIAREIELAQEAITVVSGISPVFFRAPAGLRSPLLQPVLSRLGLRLAAWTRRGFDTVNGGADSVFARLTHGMQPGDILLLHDGDAARTHSGVPVILEVLPRVLEAVAAAGLTPVALRDAI